MKHVTSAVNLLSGSVPSVVKLFARSICKEMKWMFFRRCAVNVLRRIRKGNGVTGNQDVVMARM